MFYNYRKHIFNFLTFIFTRLIALIAYAVSVPFFIRHTSATQYGIIAIGFSLLGFSTLFDVAIGYVITMSLGRRLARTGNPNQKLFQGMFSVYFYVSMILVVCAIIIVICAHLSREEQIYYDSLILLLPFLAISGVVRAVFQASNDLTYISASRFIFELCKAISLVASVLLVGDYVLVGPILLLGAVIRAIIDVVVLKKYTVYSLSLLMPSASKRYIRLALLGSYSFGSVIATLLVTIGDKLMIKKFISAAAVAHYSVAFDINAKAYILMNGINFAIYTIILKNHARGISKALQIKIALTGVVILAVGYYIPLMVYSKDIIQLLIPGGFSVETAKLTTIMAFASLIYLTGNIFENAVTAMGGVKYILYAYGFGVIVYFLTLPFLFKIFSLVGFMYSYVVLCLSLNISFVVIYVFLNRKILARSKNILH